MHRIQRPFRALTTTTDMRLFSTLSGSGLFLSTLHTSTAWLTSNHRTRVVSSQTRPLLYYSTTTTTTATNSQLSAALSIPTDPPTAPATKPDTPKDVHLSQATIVSIQDQALVTLRLDDDITDISAGDLLGHLVQFHDNVHGVVVAHRPPLLFCYLVQEHDTATTVTEQLQIGSPATVLSTHATVSSSSTIVDELGRPLKNNIENTDIQVDADNKIFAPIPQVKDIALINSPVLTGITMMDALAPLGRGQNMLWVGNSPKDLRAYAISLIVQQQKQQSQNNTVSHCVYAAISDPDSVRSELEKLNLLSSSSSSNNLQLVIPQQNNLPTASRAAQGVLAAATACALAEKRALQHGQHTLVVVDTIDMHKTLWDTTTRVLVDVFGVDAVVQSDRSGGASSEMRGFFCSLVQRAGQYKEKRGGGSVTLVLLHTIPSTNDDDDKSAVFTLDDFEHSSDKVKERVKLLSDKKIPLSAANLRKIDIPIPTEGQRRYVLQHVDDLISMTDGQIWLDTDRIKHHQPPMDAQRSVTRVGIGHDTDSRADAPALRRVVERLRLDLAQAADSITATDSSTNGMATQKQMQRQAALLLAMYQEPDSPGRTLFESCVVLLAAHEGHLDEAVKNGQEGVIDELLQSVTQSLPDVVASINSTFDMSSDERQAIKDAVTSYFGQ